MKLAELPDLGVITTAAEVLDLLLLVFIVVELLYAVRTTLAERELVAEPFLIVGIIASIKEIVVLSVKAPDYVGTDKLEDTVWLMGVLTVTIGVLAVSTLLRAPQGARAQRGRRQRPRRRPRQAGDPPEADLRGRPECRRAAVQASPARSPGRRDLLDRRSAPQVSAIRLTWTSRSGHHRRQRPAARA